MQVEKALCLSGVCYRPVRDGSVFTEPVDVCEQLLPGASWTGFLAPLGSPSVTVEIRRDQNGTVMLHPGAAFDVTFPDTEVDTMLGGTPIALHPELGTVHINGFISSQLTITWGQCGECAD